MLQDNTEVQNYVYQCPSVWDRHEQEGEEKNVSGFEF